MTHRCLCGSEAFDVVGHKDDRTVGTCSACSLLQTIDPPPAYEALYTEGDSYHIERLGQTPYRDRYEHDREVAKLRWPKLMEQFRVLDVGCANGGFLAWASEQGAMVEGLEINPNMAQWAAEQTGLVVHTGWDTVSGLFDVITYHDVIEHVADPVAELKRLTTHLFPGGIVVLDTPDAAAFGDDPMQSHHMKPQEHLWFFTEWHLLNVVETAGLMPVDVDRPIPGKIVVYARWYP